jgi:hypothetical protein
VPTKGQLSTQGTTIHHILTKDSVHLRVDCDLWLCVLDLAAVRGWGPPPVYARPNGLELSREDASRLARSIETLLPSIPEEQIPLSDQPFGAEHTEALLSRRAAGETLALEDATAATELLSGSPKREAERLARFLKTGAVSIKAG